MTRWVCGGVLLLLASSAMAQMKDAPEEVGPVPKRPRPNRPVISPTATAPQRYDRHGDPLPAGAIARYGTVRLRHGPEPIALRFSEDGKVLGSLANTNDSIRLWDPKTGKEVGRLNTPVQFAAMARDGSCVVIDDTRCKHWVPVGNTIRDLPEKTLPEGVACLAVNPSVRSFAVGSPHVVTLIDLETGKHLRQLKYPGDQTITRLVYSSDGHWLGGMGESTGIFLWDLRTFKRVRTYRTEHNYPDFAFSTDGTRLVVAGEHLRVYPTDSEEMLEGYKAPEMECLSPRFSADGKWVFALSPSGDLHQVNATTGEEKDPVAAPDQMLHPPLAMSPDAAFVAAVDQSGGIRMWDPKTGKGPEADRLPALVEPGFSADGKTIWALTLDGRLHSFEAATGKPGKNIALPIDADAGVSWDPASRRATTVVAGEEFELQVVDVDTRKIVGKISVPTNEGLPIPVFCPSDRNRVAIFLQGSVEICNITTGKTVRTITISKAEDSAPCRGAVSPDGRLIAIAANGVAPVTVWELVTGKKRFELAALPGAVGAAFSADGRYVAGWDAAGKVAVFDLRFGTLTRRLEADREEGGISVAFAPDAKRLAVGGQDGRITIWDLGTGDPVITFDRHDGFVTGLVWSRDGTRLASSATDGTVLVWEVPEKTNPKVNDSAVAGFDEAFRLLGSPEPANAQRGIEHLYKNAADTPKQCLNRIPIPALAAPGRIAKLIVELDDEDFQVRAAAVKELAAIGGETVPHLRKTVEKTTSAEVRKLALDLLTRIETGTPKPDDLRALRALEVLESLATAEAKAVLTKWAGGPVGHRLTTEATAALTRLKQRGN